MNQTIIDPDLGTIVNTTEVSDEDVQEALGRVFSDDMKGELAALTSWSRSVKRTSGGIFNRDKYMSPGNIFDEMRTAKRAAHEDDVVSGVIDTTEGLAFGKMSFSCLDEDEEDVWNQIAGDLDLDSRIREMWRELFVCSQVYVAIYWGEKDYKVRGKTKKGVTRKKQFQKLEVPLGISILDPLKVVPLGSLMFNREQLGYLANRGENTEIDAVLDGKKDDPIISSIIVGKYDVSADPTAQAMMRSLGFHADAFDRVYLLNPQNVFRHTDTRSQYEPFAQVRMASIFELLDLKHNLRQMDRTHLLGGTNFIVLVTKGSDQIPARPEEIANLQAGVRTVAQMPVLVGDHRLDVKIVTPKLDQTLQPERYNNLDSRITARLYHMFNTGNYAAGAKGDDSIKLARVVAHSLESRRHMMSRTIEAHLLDPTYEKNADFTTHPKMKFHPKRIDLQFDPAVAQYLLDLRDRGDISRASILEEVQFSEAEEAERRKREAKDYDSIFKPVNVPVPGVKPGGPAADTPSGPKAGGRSGGGNRNGGGAAPGSGQGQAPRNPSKKSD